MKTDETVTNCNGLQPVPCGCGGEAKVGHIEKTSYLPKDRWYIGCPKCDICTGIYDTEAEAVTAWNRAMSGNDYKSKSVERTAKLDHTYQVGENWYCENCGQQLNAYDWETPQNLAELGDENAQVSEVTSQNNGGTWQKTERTAKVEILEMRNTHNKVWKCSNCGQYMHRANWSREVKYCPHCGARLEWDE